MSNLTNDETTENSWISLADLLWQPKGSGKLKVTVALLKRIIHAEGIWVRVENGELITATDSDDEKEFTSKTRAYKLLDLYFSELIASYDLPPGVHPDQDPDRWLGYGSPLIDFGWADVEAPNFAHWIAKSQFSRKTSSNVVKNISSETRFCEYQSHDITKERGCRRLILENWKEIKLQYGDNADSRQVLRILKKHKDEYDQLPKLKTVQNRLNDLRKEKLIP